MDKLEEGNNRDTCKSTCTYAGGGWEVGTLAMALKRARSKTGERRAVMSREKRAFSGRRRPCTFRSLRNAVSIRYQLITNTPERVISLSPALSPSTR